MTTNHTPEPWKVVPSVSSGMIHNIAGENGRALAGVYHAPDKMQPILIASANAARIVSCVNALAGMNPEALPALLDACAWYLSVNSCENRAKLRAALAALKESK